jgi:EAL domain-containing protein (putative c-di-GMP-specific phosphodiesterase class I)
LPEPGLDTRLAEGVETAEQVALLTSLKCDHVQGYYFSRPLTLDAARKFLIAHGEALPCRKAS